MNGILQGTTPKLVITIPDTCPLSSVTDIELTMAHKCEKVIYGLADVTIDTEENTVTYAFTEAQTLALDPKVTVNVAAIPYAETANTYGTTVTIG